MAKEVVNSMNMLDSFDYDQELIEKLKKLHCEWCDISERWWCPKETLAKAKKLVSEKRNDKPWMKVPYEPAETT